MALFGMPMHEWVDWAVLLLTTVLSTLLLYAVPTYCRPFQWDDPSINYPNLPDTFPTYSLLLMLVTALLFYTVFVLYVEPQIRQRRRRRWRALASSGASEYASTMMSSTSVGVPRRGPLYPWLKAQLWAAGLQYAIVDIMKVYTGRLRPDFLARLASAGITQATSKHDPHTQPEYFCALSRKSASLINGRLSYPSGHAAAAFSVCTMVTLFLLAHARPLARHGSFARLLLTLSPLSVAFICALTRTRDYKHNFSDITTGSLLGIMSALLAFAVCFREVHGGLNIYRARCVDDWSTASAHPDSPTNMAAVAAGNGGAVGRVLVADDTSTLLARNYGGVSTNAGDAGDATMTTALSRSNNNSNGGGGDGNNNNNYSNAPLPYLQHAHSLSSPPPLCDIDRDPAVVPWV